MQVFYFHRLLKLMLMHASLHVICIDLWPFIKCLFSPQQSTESSSHNRISLISDDVYKLARFDQINQTNFIVIALMLNRGTFVNYAQRAYINYSASLPSPLPLPTNCLHSFIYAPVADFQWNALLIEKIMFISDRVINEGRWNSQFSLLAISNSGISINDNK